jgi:hypothetical protein
MVAGSTITFMQGAASTEMPALSAPVLSSPVGGQTVDTVTPALVVTNSVVTGNAGSVTYRFEVSELDSFPDNSRTTTQDGIVQGSGGTTSWQSPHDFIANTLHYWRARATAGTMMSAYSRVETFRTPLCEYTLSPASQDVTIFGGAFTFTATRNTPNGCSWTASTATPWITLTGPTSGASPGTISYGVTTSNWPIVRTGKIDVQWSGGSVDFAVTQAAVVGSCNSPIAGSIPASQRGGLIYIGQGCFYLLGAREIDVPWITVRGTSGGALYLDVLYDENTGPERTGHITYRGYDGAVVLLITVTQAAGSRP